MTTGRPVFVALALVATLLALRVVAARSIEDRDSFRETFDRLVAFGAGRYQAFTTTMRAMG